MDNNSLEVVFVVRARCPICKSADLQTLRSQRVYAEVVRATRCRECNHRFKVIVGDDDDAASDEDF